MTTATVERPTQRRNRRSVSQLKDYLHCSWAYRLKRIKKVQESPSVWLAGGKAFHEVSEGVDRLVWDEGVATLADLDVDSYVMHFEVLFGNMLDELSVETGVPIEKFRTAGRKTIAKPRGEDADWWREAGADMVRKYIDWRRSTADSLVLAPVAGAAGIEVEVDMPLGGETMLGYVDRLFADASSGELLVVDLKTGSRTPQEPIQLATYALQLERLIKRPITWGAYYMAREGKLTDPIDLSGWDLDNLGLMYRNFGRGVDDAVFLPNLGSHCKACGVKDACIFQGGSEPPTTEAP